MTRACKPFSLREKKAQKSSDTLARLIKGKGYSVVTLTLLVGSLFLLYTLSEAASSTSLPSVVFPSPSFFHTGTGNSPSPSLASLWRSLPLPVRYTLNHFLGRTPSDTEASLNVENDQKNNLSVFLENEYGLEKGLPDEIQQIMENSKSAVRGMLKMMTSSNSLIFGVAKNKILDALANYKTHFKTATSRTDEYFNLERGFALLKDYGIGDMCVTKLTEFIISDSGKDTLEDAIKQMDLPSMIDSLYDQSFELIMQSARNAVNLFTSENFLKETFEGVTNVCSITQQNALKLQEKTWISTAGSWATWFSFNAFSGPISNLRGMILKAVDNNMLPTLHLARRVFIKPIATQASRHVQSMIIRLFEKLGSRFPSLYQSFAARMQMTRKSDKRITT